MAKAKPAHDALQAAANAGLRAAIEHATTDLRVEIADLRRTLARYRALALQLRAVEGEASTMPEAAPIDPAPAIAAVEAFPMPVAPAIRPTDEFAQEEGRWI